MVVLVLLSLIWTWLFFENAPGINVLLFTICLMVAQGWTSPQVWQEGSNKYIGLLWLAAAIAVAWHGSALAVLATLLITLAGTGLRYLPATSIPTSLLNSTASIAASFLYDMLAQKPESEQHKNNLSSRLSRLIKLGLIPGIIIFLFFILYVIASDNFGDMSERIFEHLSMGRFFFFGFGFVLLYGLFHYQPIRPLSEQDINTGDALERIRKRKYRSFAILALRNEYLRAILLFSGLNLLLVIFHLSDLLDFLRPTAAFTNYSALVHQGVNTLILSILLAIVLILFHFRGNLNFYSKSRPLRQLVYGWIALNALLVITTLIKNYGYIEHYGLTYKRIGVIYFLVLAMAGLLLTGIKVSQRRNFWFLLRSNAWVILVVSTFFSLFHWNGIISQYNLQRGLGYEYVLKLGDSNTQIIAQYLEVKPYAFAHECKLHALWNTKLARSTRQLRNLRESTWLDYQQTSYLQHLPENPAISPQHCD